MVNDEYTRKDEGALRRIDERIKTLNEAHAVQVARVQTYLQQATQNITDYRVGGALRSPSSHTTVRAMSHTAVSTKLLTL
jgi:hypothetical protein